MKNREKKEIEQALFKEVNNKKDVIEKCNRILDVKFTSDCKHTKRRFAIISVACLVFVVALAMIIFIPPVFKDNGPSTYYFNQSDLKWENVDDIESFIMENNIPIKRLTDNINNVGKICYHEDTYVGLLQELIVISDEDFEIGTVFICKSNFVIKDEKEKIFDEVVIAGTVVGYIEYENADENICEFTFSYKGYNYDFVIHSTTNINLEYYLKQIIE